MHRQKHSQSSRKLQVWTQLLKRSSIKVNFWRMRTWDIGSINLAPAGQNQSKLNELAGTTDVHGASRSFKTRIEIAMVERTFQYSNVEGTNYYATFSRASE